MRRLRSIRNKSINYLSSFGRNDREIKNIRTKFQNISGKTGSYNVPDELFLQRVARYNRALISYRTVIRNNLSITELDSFENGVTVEFVNNDYFTPNDDPVTLFLKNRLGSNENISSIIVIKSEGDPSSSVQRVAYNNIIEHFGEEVIQNNLLKRSSNYSGSKGNENWEGFIYYNIKGGQQDTLMSHNGLSVNLFNPAVEYASTLVSLHIDLVLIYFALHSIRIEERDPKIFNLVKDTLDQINYDNCSLLDYCNQHLSLRIDSNHLIDPIQVTPINITDFALISQNDSVDITHNIPVNEEIFNYDNTMQTILSPANPTNLFWSKHLSNMMQQNMSLSEYIDFQENCIRRRQNI